jgi:hypothetical protein
VGATCLARYVAKRSSDVKWIMEMPGIEMRDRRCLRAKHPRFLVDANRSLPAISRLQCTPPPQTAVVGSSLPMSCGKYRRTLIGFAQIL